MFESFVMNIVDGVVTSIRRFDPQSGEARDAVSETKHVSRVKAVASIQKHFGDSKT